MMKGISESSTLIKHISCECDVNLMIENVIRNKNGISISIYCECKKNNKAWRLRKSVCLES